MKSLFKDLNWKFGGLMALIITMVMLAEQAFLMKQARVGMESRLGEKAAFINTFYAFLIADALQRKDDVTLLQVINRLEEDPEITSVVVVDNKNEVRYHVDSEKLGTDFEDPVIKKAMETGDGVMNPFQNSGGRALVLVSPLKIQGQPKPIGVVRIEFTYKHVQEQLSKFSSSFQMAVLGFISAGVGFLMIFLRRWITLPLEMLEKSITGLHLVTAEANFPETPDEFGQVNKALNEMINRFHVEVQEQQGSGAATPAEIEKELVERLMSSFLPGTRLIIADKENRILSELNNGQPVAVPPGHLLDFITDINFANLVGAAFQTEGVPACGAVTVGEQTYNAAVLCIPENQSKAVRAVIALQAQSNKGESST